MKKRIICVGSGLAAIQFMSSLPAHMEVYWFLDKGYHKTNSYLAKGGIAISFAEDNITHMADTIAAGANLNDTGIVEEVIGASVTIFETLQNQGVIFESEPSREGGHSKARIQHVSDQTGSYLVEHLWQTVLKRKNTKLFFDWELNNLMVQNGVCIGIKACNTLHGEQFAFYAAAVVLATGGIGNLYLHHTNALTANGVGFAVASRAGAHMADMEFVQFHPTKLYSENEQKNVLVTEAFRGAGAMLLDANGKSFMDAIHPQGSLAPRDVVALAMYGQMKKDQNPWIYLDYSRVPEDSIKADFPYLHSQIVLEEDAKQKRIKVMPAAHYMCGGIAVNNYAETSITNLFALGEVARTGLHGANRLASNSLLELLYFGNKLAKNIDELTSNVVPTCEKLSPLQVVSAMDINHYYFQLKNIMWQCFGVVRTPIQMAFGYNQLMQLRFTCVQLGEASIPYYRFLNSLDAAIIMATFAIKRKNAVGCHQLLAELTALSDV